jgi:hypothetical protein
MSDREKKIRVIQISPKQLWMAVVLVFLSVGGMVGTSIGYTNYGIRNSNQAWCDMFEDLRKPAPNAAPEAVGFAAKIDRIARKYHC